MLAQHGSAPAQKSAQHSPARNSASTDFRAGAGRSCAGLRCALGCAVRWAALGNLRWACAGAGLRWRWAALCAGLRCAGLRWCHPARTSRIQCSTALAAGHPDSMETDRPRAECISFCGNSMPSLSVENPNCWLRLEFRRAPRFRGNGPAPWRMLARLSHFCAATMPIT